jgi:RNA polymerase sigma factor (sigma-70 family)
MSPLGFGAHLTIEMSEADDNELLNRFRESGSDEAFAAIVHRHVSLVYSVALRHTSNSSHAEEITQAVFVILARKATSLDRRAVLSGWLYHTARLTAANFVRSEVRRSRREREALMQSTADEPADQKFWTELSPFLDEAMARLRPVDRDALVLRYFENKSLPEVGTALGVGERAAQKRVDRALQKLRILFAKRGICATVAVIAAEISAHAVGAAPLGLAPKIAAAAVKGSAVAGSTLTLVKETLRVMTRLKTKIAASLGAATLLAVGACMAITHHENARQERQNDAQLRQEKLAAEQAEQAERAEKVLREQQSQAGRQ